LAESTDATTLEAYPRKGEIDVNRSGTLAVELIPVALIDLPVAPGDVVPARATAGAGQRRRPVDIVEEWGMQSFPASDPPANW
jgi:hypothetical protein